MAHLYIAVYRRAPTASWPYDLGDDPAFEASEILDGKGRVIATERLTWGVCRTNLRNIVKRDDLVTFFATDRDSPFRYYFVAMATVECKIDRRTIWRNPDLAVFQKYRNTLLRREPGGFHHYEGGNHYGVKIWHKDWLARMVSPHQRRNSDFHALQATHTLPNNAKILGDSVQLADNYVMFRPEGPETFVAANPPLVAEARKSGEIEIWKRDRFSRDLKKLLLAGEPSRDYLRTTHVQRAHPHIKVKVSDAAERRKQLFDLFERYGLASRLNSVKAGHAARQTEPPHEASC